MKRADVVGAAVLASLGGYVFVETSGYPGSLVPGSPGPAFFPRLLGALLVACAVALLIQAVRTAEGSGGPAPSWPHLRRPALVLGSTAVFLLIVEQGDFFLMLVPLLAVVMAVMGERRAGTLVLAPVLFSAFVYVVFFRLFGVPFPTVL